MTLRQVKALVYRKFEGAARWQNHLTDLPGNVMIALVCSAPSAAWAAPAPWDNAADGILDILNGGLMRTIAVIVVILVGVGILVGRVAMEIGVRVIGGIVVIFAAGALVDLIISWST